MDYVLKHLLAASLAAGIAWSADAAAPAPKFYADDPVESLPDLAPVLKPRKRKIDPLVDFVKQSIQPDRRAAVPSEAVNTLGEVPDSNWYTNRHARRRMSLEELRSGSGDQHPPMAPFQIVGGKSEGITPGFTIRDARGRKYFLKPDPESNPEMATAADVIGSKFFYALGYFTPENYILKCSPADFTIAGDAQVKGVNGKMRAMRKRDMAILLDKMPRRGGGAMRFVASRELPGEALGPFKYAGTRSDDPNDVTPHERRRDLRGLHVLAAWLNHTDAKAGNSLDVLVNEGGRPVIRHYLIDFGAMLGSDSDMPKDARFGHEYILPKGKDALHRMFTFGLAAQPWESIEYPDNKAVGRFTAEGFDPRTWKSNYPNPAFLSRTPEDEYWAAKLVMAFTNEDIRAIVETGDYSDPAAADYIVATLIQRRDRIGEVYFNQTLALDHFRVEAGALRYEDLLARYGFSPVREMEHAWYRFDNRTRAIAAIAGARSAGVPREAREARDGSYFMVRVQVAGDTRERSVRVYLRMRAGRLEVAGIDRG